MRAETIIIPVVVAVLVTAAVLFFLTQDVKVSVSQPTAQAQAGLPSDVEKFQDGEVTCYTLNNYNAWTSSFVGGISCVK